MLDELSDTLTRSNTTVVAYEFFIERVKSSISYRFLNTDRLPTVRGKSLSLYRRLKNICRKHFYTNDLILTKLLKLLREYKIDLIHFPQQYISFPDLASYYPYIINPHDYQHEYYPEFFSESELKKRRTVWYQDQRSAQAIVTHSQQTYNDAAKFLEVSESKIFYSQYGPLNTFPMCTKSSTKNVLAKYNLPNRFVFYPARMWPHKNHIALLRSGVLLRDKGIHVDFVFTDSSTEHAINVKEAIEELSIGDRVHILGRIDKAEMSALYTACTLVVVPSIFEQNSGPMLEAIYFSKAIAVSNIPELVSSLNGAGLIFEPESVSDIADCIERIWCNEKHKTALEQAAHKRSREMSWSPFIDCYKDAYKHAIDTFSRQYSQ